MNSSLQNGKQSASKPVAVFYATREGHTRLIAESVASNLRAHGIRVDCRDLAVDTGRIALNNYAAAIFAASVHVGSHERELTQFVKGNRGELDLLPTALLSVTLSQAGVEMTESSQEARTRSANDVQKMIDKFVEETGWRPRWIKPVAGALLYSKYNFLLKLIMKRIAKKAGAGTDTSRDYIYTNWNELDRFTLEFAGNLSRDAALDCVI